MGDMGDIHRDLKAHRTQRRQDNLAGAQAELSKPRWTRHTDYHHSTMVDGRRLDYWPSRNKWMVGGKVISGSLTDLLNYISKRETKTCNDAT